MWKKRQKSTVAPAAKLYFPTSPETQEAEHHERAAALSDGFLARRSRREKHPVDDFMFTYYSMTPGQLKRWHPGGNAVVHSDQARTRLDWKFYRPLTQAERRSLGILSTTAAATVDAESFARERGTTVTYVRQLLQKTAGRPAQFGCFGMHEWAMVYRSELNGVRHDYLDLRLGGEGTDRVVEEAQIRCTHFDAYRFYTPQARGLNVLTPTREAAPELEQPGCLHANMDVYKWAYKLLPLVPSEFVVRAAELARRIRTMDMQASPYDLSKWGYAPIAIETSAGKAEYVSAQREFAAESAVLRAELLHTIDT